MSRRQRHAMTLIEVLIALALLGAALLPVFDLMLHNRRQSRFSEDRLLAAMRLRTVLDRYRGLEATDLATRFPPNGAGSSALDQDLLLAAPAGLTLTDEEQRQAAAFERRFAIEVWFEPEGDGRTGCLAARAAWTSVTRQSATLTAREWIGRRNDPRASF